MTAVLKPLPLRFWRSANGHEPVREWLAALEVSDKKLIGRDIAKVQYRWPVGLPLCRSMGDGLWEIRSSLPGRREVRVIFGFSGGVLVALHVFFKKSRRTPDEDLNLARERWLELT
jgi:phage-related protein